jgi:hypothetical protein
VQHLPRVVTSTNKFGSIEVIDVDVVSGRTNSSVRGPSSARLLPGMSPAGRCSSVSAGLPTPAGLADVMNEDHCSQRINVEVVVIVAGDGEVPHPAIAAARRPASDDAGGGIPTGAPKSLSRTHWCRVSSRGKWLARQHQAG